MVSDGSPENSGPEGVEDEEIPAVENGIVQSVRFRSFTKRSSLRGFSSQPVRRHRFPQCWQP